MKSLPTKLIPGRKGNVTADGSTAEVSIDVQKGQRIIGVELTYGVEGQTFGTPLPAKILYQDQDRTQSIILAVGYAGNDSVLFGSQPLIVDRPFPIPFNFNGQLRGQIKNRSGTSIVPSMSAILEDVAL